MENNNTRTSNYRYCAQIMISHVKKTKDVHSKLLEILNKDFDLFGRIYELKVLRQAKNNITREKDTIAFLKYVKNTSHWEAIEHYNTKGLYFMDKKLYFRPSGFTNDETNGREIEHNVRCVRLGQFGMPLNGATALDNAVTRPRELIITRRVSANDDITVIHEPQTQQIADDEQYRCLKCNSIQNFGDFNNHKEACTGPSELETRVQSYSSVIRNQITHHEQDSSLLRFLDERCCICQESMILLKNKEIKSLICGHRIHMECYNGLIANGIPCSKQRFDYGIDPITQLPVAAQIVDLEVFLYNYSNKVYACPLCRMVGTSQMLNFSSGRKWYYVQPDLVEINDGN